MKGVFLIGFAVFIDALQAGFALVLAALQFATPIGGGVSGALAGCYLNASAWYDLAGCLKGAVVGGAALAGASAIAIPIGAMIDVALSVTLGGALIAALVFTGTFSFGAVMGGSLVEMVPLLDSIAPGWTLMAWRCVREARRREEAKAQEETLIAVAPLGTTPAFDGIRPANDNFYEAQAAA